VLLTINGVIAHGFTRFLPVYRECKRADKLCYPPISPLQGSGFFCSLTQGGAIACAGLAWGSPLGLVKPCGCWDVEGVRCCGGVGCWRRETCRTRLEITTLRGDPKRCRGHAQSISNPVEPVWKSPRSGVIQGGAGGTRSPYLGRQNWADAFDHSAANRARKSNRPIARTLAARG
jgi:hypothetical protein